MGIVSDILEHARRTPDKPALEDATGQVSYAELARYSKNLAAHLLDRGLQLGDRVAIQMENNRHYVVAIVACLRAGLAWVPVNYTLSDEKLGLVVAGCQPKLLVTDEAQVGRAHAIYGADTPVLVCDVREIALAGAQPLAEVYARELGPIAEPLDQQRLAYVIYTSGSTGAPKGVAVSLASLANYAYATCHDLGFHGGTRTLSVTPYYFDAPLGSIFCTLMRGGTLCIYPKLLFPRVVAKKVIEHDITYIGTTPGLFRILLDALQASGSARVKLEVVGVGGDIASRDDLFEFLRLCPQVKVFNRYGPTETTSVSSGYRILPEDLRGTEPIPIGKPLPGVSYYLVDEAGKLVEGSGARGELYIGGVQVMRGYFGDPELSARVLDDSLVTGDVLYKTGDVCSRDARGNYVFHNRVGGLMKRQGVRIYLSEIELAVEACRNVKSCVCVNVNDESGAELVVAFVVPHSGVIERDALIAELFGKHPPYAVPDDVQNIAALPFTTIGKVDRKALLAGYVGRAAKQGLVPLPAGV